MNRANLYEDNAGGLYVNIEGNEGYVYRITHPELSQFTDDAMSLLDGDEWQGVDTAPLSDIADLAPIACYDGDLTIFETPGTNGRIYLSQ